MGRGPFFGSSRKMRGFPMNLSPGGLDDGPPGFPYFATADGKFEFGYGGSGFHHDFFPGHHPHQGPGGPIPFPGPGKSSLNRFQLCTSPRKCFGRVSWPFLLSAGGPMDGSLPMHGGDFGGITPEPPTGFMPGPPPGPEQQQQIMSQRSSPEFISTQLLGKTRQNQTFLPTSYLRVGHADNENSITFLTGGNNGFSDPPTSQNEGLVW